MRPARVVLAVMLAACAPREPASTAGADGGEELRAGVERALDAYLDAIANRDSVALRALYVGDDRFVWIEEGAVRYRSAEDVLESLAAFPTDVPIETTLGDLTIVPAGESAAHAWAHFETRVGEGEQAFAFSGAISIVFERSGGSWRILGGHASSPAPDGEGDGGS